MEAHLQYYLKMADYCSYQERCTHEVVTKLADMEAKEEWMKPILDRLKKENFLNDHRFAHSYARGKFRFKKWGKLKIKFNLKLKKIEPSVISSALAALDTEGYNDTLLEILKIKINTQHLTNTFANIAKLYRYAVGKGYETDLVRDAINSLWKTKLKI